MSPSEAVAACVQQVRGLDVGAHERSQALRQRGTQAVQPGIGRVAMDVVTRERVARGVERRGRGAEEGQRLPE